MSFDSELNCDSPSESNKAEFKIRALEPRLLMSATWVEPDIDDQAEEDQQEEDESESGKLSKHGSDLLEAMKSDDGLFEAAEESVKSSESVGDGKSTQDHMRADKLSGGSGNDVLRGGSGDDRLIGGEGDDVARFDRDMSDYDIAHNEDGSWTVTALNGADGTDTLWDIERLVFSDQTVTLDTVPQAQESSISIHEDETFVMSLSGADGDSNGRIESFRVESLPEGGTLTISGEKVKEGAVISAADVEGGRLEFTPSQNHSGTTSFEFSASDGDNWSEKSAKIDITITGVADAAELDVSSSVSVSEDGTVGLPIDASLTDVDGSESLTVEIANAPAGTTFTDGVNTVVSEGGPLVVSGWDLANLELSPAADSDADFDLEIRATSTEAAGGDSRLVTQSVHVDVTGVADAATMVIGEDGPVQILEGLEGSPTALPITAALADVDGSESLVIVVRGLPAGSELSTGTPNEDGTWTLEPGQLEELSFRTPFGYSGTFALEVDAVSTEAGSGDTTRSTASVQVEIAAGDTGVGDDTGDDTTQTDTVAESEIVKNVEGSFLEGTGARFMPWGGGPGFNTILDLAGSKFDQLETDGREFVLSGADGRRFDVPEQGITTLQLDDVDIEIVSSNLRDIEPLSNLEDGIEVPVELPKQLPDLNNAETVLVSGVPTGAVLSHGWRMDGDIWIVPPRHVHGLTLKMPVHSTGTIKMKFEVFGAVTSAFISTASVAADYEDTGSDEVPTSDDVTLQHDFS